MQNKLRFILYPNSITMNNININSSNTNNIIYYVIVGLILFFVVKSILAFRDFKRAEQFASDFLYEHEPTRAGQINASPYLSIAQHVRLDKFNRVQGITTRPPLPKEGETDCIEVTCESIYPSNARCWRCS